MRVSRSSQLYTPSGLVHMVWRCHNREFYLFHHGTKLMYLACLLRALKRKFVADHVKVHSFCFMSNHVHQVASYTNGSAWLSLFMRYAHSLFGASFNKQNNRSGKVAEGRPYTPLIEDQTHLMRVQFYIESNPIRAKMRTLTSLATYKYSSYGFFAHGYRNEFTELITLPDWYLELGKTAHQRQQKYRELFRQYLEAHSPDMRFYFSRFIGSNTWVLSCKRMSKSLQLSRPMSLQPEDSS